MVIAYATSTTGPASTTFAAGETIFGRISGAGPALSACTARASSTDCSAFPTNWVTFPANGWSYDAPSATWRATLAPNTFPAGTYTSAAREPSGRAAAPVTFTITGPVIVVSDVIDGAPRTTFAASAVIFGRIEGLGPTQAQSCAEPFGASTCASLSSWTTLPANGWTYDAAAAAWRTSFASNALTPGRYVSYARNAAEGSLAEPVTVTVTGPTVIYSDVFDGAPRTTLRADQPIFARITGSSASTQVCSELSSGMACASLSNWTTLPANGWAFDGTTWRASFAANMFASGTYVTHARDAQDGSRAAPVTVTLTGTAMPVCSWSAVVPGPVTPPSMPCTTANVGAMTQASGYTWTCTCT